MHRKVARRTVRLVARILFLAVVLLALHAQGALASSSWWDTNWHYRRPITVTSGENGMPENYQLYVVLPFDSDMKENFEDIRFIWDDGTFHELPYWIESYTVEGGADNTITDEGDNAYVWVKLGVSLGANENTDNLYVYYGNPNATSASNSDDTFDFFDDFDDGSINSSKWKTEIKLGDPDWGTEITESNGYIQVRARAGNVSAEAKLYSVLTFSPPLVFEAMRQADGLNWSWWLGMCWGDNFFRAETASEQANSDFRWVSSESGSKQATGWSTSYDVTDWMKVSYVWTSTVEFWEDGVLRFTADNENRVPDVSLPVYARAASRSSGETQDRADVWVRMDWVRIRKYADPEPTASVGGEESPPKIKTVSPDNTRLDRDRDWHPGVVHGTRVTVDAQTSDANDIADNARLTVYDAQGGEVAVLTATDISVSENTKRFVFVFDTFDYTLADAQLGGFDLCVEVWTTWGGYDNLENLSAFQVLDLAGPAPSQENVPGHRHRIYGSANFIGSTSDPSLAEAYLADSTVGEIGASVSGKSYESTYKPDGDGTVYAKVRSAEVDGVTDALDYVYPNIPPEIVQISSSEPLVDRDEDSGSGPTLTTTITVRVRDPDNRDDLRLGLWLRDGSDTLILDNVGVVNYDNVDENTRDYWYVYDPSDTLPDGALGPFDVKVQVVDSEGGTTTEDFEGAGHELFTVDDLVVTLNVADNRPVYRLEASGTVARVFGTVSADNVVLVDNNEGSMVTEFTDSSFTKTYGLVSPVRLHRGDLGQLYVWARDDTLDGVSPPVTYRVEGDNCTISDISVSNDRQVRFKVTWDSDDAKVNGTAYLTDNADIQGPVADGIGQIDATNAKSGNHTLSLFDNADRPLNRAYSSSFYLPPTVRVENLKTDGQVNPTKLTTSTPTFSWDYHDLLGKPQTKYQIWVGRAVGSYDAWDSGEVASDATQVVYAGSELERGRTYYVQVRVHNGVEWSDWCTGSFALNVPPTASTLSADTIGGYVGSEDVTLYVGASDPDGSVTEMAFSLDGVEWTWMPYSTTATYRVSPVEGVLQQIHFVVRDDSGENSNVLTTTVVLDRTPPEGLSLVSPAENAVVGPTDVVLDWTPAQDLVSGVVACYLVEYSSDPDFSSPTERWTVRTSMRIPYEGQRGDFYWRVHVWDRVGNENVTPVRRWTYCPDAPKVVLGNIPDYVNTTSLAIELEGDAAELRYAVGGEADLDLAQWENFSSTVTVQLPAEEGRQVVWLEFRSVAGVVAGPFSASVILDYSPPQLSVSPREVWTRENRAEFELDASDAVSGVSGLRVWVAGHGEGAWENFSGRVVVDLPVWEENDFTVCFKVRDRAGNESAVRTAVARYRAEAHPPEVEIPERVSGRTFTFTGRVEPGSEVWVNGVKVQVLPDGSFTAAVALEDETSTITLRVRDPAGNERTETYTVTAEFSGEGLPLGIISLAVLGSVAALFLLSRLLRSEEERILEGGSPEEIRELRFAK